MSPTLRPNWSAITNRISDGGTTFARLPEAVSTPQAISAKATGTPVSRNSASSANISGARWATSQLIARLRRHRGLPARRP